MSVEGANGPGVPRQRVYRDAAALDDLALLERIRRGMPEAYDELYRRHADAVRRYARTCCRDEDTANDLVHEVFAATLQAVRNGAGPGAAVRPYLLASVRRVAARWARTARRERLVEDFAVFAVSAAGVAAGADTVEQGADVRAMREAERSLMVRAFRSLPERWQAVLWHTAVEESSPQEVAPLLGLTPNATAVLAHRAREGLRRAYLQAHVSEALAAGGECARYAGRLGAYARGGLRVRAERALTKHLKECVRCARAALELRDLNERFRLVLPVAVLGWFAADGAARGGWLVLGAGGAGGTSGAGAAGLAGQRAGKGAGKSAEKGAGKGATVRSHLAAGVATGVVTSAVAAVLALVLLGGGATQPAPGTERDDERGREPEVAAPGPESEPPSSPPSSLSPPPPPSPEPEPERGPAPGPDAALAPPDGAGPSGGEPGPEQSPPPEQPGPPASPEPAVPSLPPHQPEPPEPGVPYRLAELDWDLRDDGSRPALVLADSTVVWQRGGGAQDSRAPWVPLAPGDRAGLAIGGGRYAHGISVPGPSSVTVVLNRECRTYRALAGIDDLTPLPEAAATFRVYGDGELLWRSDAPVAGAAPVAVSVDLAGVERLRLEVEPSAVPRQAVLADWAESEIVC
ncbi:sigma-70 family RNA polymerase sigma factor [Streptomyces sp. 7-21]|uniref:sigma-70 family RNA polymerase sigma factor n=1 Tax=Streptomyces sp. 7-21 TaxID=2802283 RepID=UPI00192032D7|nr:sigma-70 family RNA polymerase sigma factor [Streptomyces sp. 7-21]MBL1065870.1 sigma-70 family RNA polymerase sigma factor [Streptomyces sp. 7-21]